MNRLQQHNAARRKQRRTGGEAGARTLLLLMVVFLLGIAVSAIWFYITSRRGPAGANGERGGASTVQLSDATRAVLSRLDSPLEIRFYALLDPATVPESVTALPSRVEELLSAYQQEAGGKVKVTTFSSQSNTNANAAVTDGMQPFNAEKGEACYLGLALVMKARKETLPRVAPEWAQALEPDLTRAIVRLQEATRVAAAPMAISHVNTAAVQEVKALIPNLADVSMEAGKEILRNAALKDLSTAAKEMEAQVKEAQQRLAGAQGDRSETNQQAAVKYLQQIQAEQAARIQQIAARAKAQMDAFQQLQAAAH